MTTPYLPQMSDVVIDLSQANAGGIVAVVLKATQGIGFVDLTFTSRAVEAKHALGANRLVG
jgi:ABC-type phosphate transport system substrate-binding protein